MYNSKPEIANMQHIILDMLTEIDRICQKNNIHYSLHGGSLLGAVREHGFIPWDDDGDISMTREEFSKFARVFNKQCGGYHIIIDGWIYRIVKRNDEDSISVDLFVYDKISNNKISRLLKLSLLRFLQGMLKDDIVWDNYSGIGKLLTAITYFVGKLFPKRFKQIIYRFVATSVCVGDGSSIHRSDDAFKDIAKIIPKEAMQDYEYMEFEDTSFMVSSGYKEILTSCYGPNYMTPPDVKDRVSVHNSNEDPHKHRFWN